MEGTLVATAARPQRAHSDEELSARQPPMTPMAAQSFYLEPLIRCKMRASRSRLTFCWFFKEGRDVEDRDPVQTHLA